MAFPKVEPGTFLVIRTSGKEEVCRYKDEASLLKEMRIALGFETFDFVRVGKAWGDPLLTMIVDDLGYEFEVVEHSPTHREHVPTQAKKPINKRATELYHAICVPGTTHQIVGDVALFHDSK